MFLSLLSSEQCSQFERFHPHHFQFVDKTSSFKTKLIAVLTRRAELTAMMFNFPTYQAADYPLQITITPRLTVGRRAGTLPLKRKIDLHVSREGAAEEEGRPHARSDDRRRGGRRAAAAVAGVARLQGLRVLQVEGVARQEPGRHVGQRHGGRHLPVPRHRQV